RRHAGRHDPPADGARMSAVFALTALSLNLNFRNRMAILYGYLFPLVFLIAFWALYRNDPVPLALHIGQLLTITVLGGACCRRARGSSSPACWRRGWCCW